MAELSLTTLFYQTTTWFDSVLPWKYIFVYSYAVNADFFSLWKAVCSHLSWSFSLWNPRYFFLPFAASESSRASCPPSFFLWWDRKTQALVMPGTNLARTPESHLHRAVCLQWPSRWLSDKESTCSAGDAGDVGSIPGLGRSPREGNGNPFQHSCLEKSHGQKSLVDCSPWGLRESDTT